MAPPDARTPSWQTEKKDTIMRIRLIPLAVATLLLWPTSALAQAEDPHHPDDGAPSAAEAERPPTTPDPAPASPQGNASAGQCQAYMQSTQQTCANMMQMMQGGMAGMMMPNRPGQGDTAGGLAMPGGAMPEGMMPGGVMPEGMMPGGAMPEGMMPGGMTPEGMMPGGTMSDAARAYAQTMSTMDAAMMAAVQSDDPDVAFVQAMIPHHQGAIDMAAAVLRFGSDPRVMEWAIRIIEAQKAEIAEMTAWLSLRVEQSPTKE
ncbi:MAG: DUF305 domain-containing protein [Bauldia sp.]